MPLLLPLIECQAMTASPAHQTVVRHAANRHLEPRTTAEASLSANISSKADLCAARSI